MKINPTVRARQLRCQQTTCEKYFWRCVRNRAFLGLKFVRQHPIEFITISGEHKFFVADFYCDKYKLAIEIDGDVHNQLVGYDKFRDKIIETQGIKVIHVKNDDVINNIWFVLRDIERYVKSVDENK